MAADELRIRLRGGEVYHRGRLIGFASATGDVLVVWRRPREALLRLCLATIAEQRSRRPRRVILAGATLVDLADPDKSRRLAPFEK